MLVFTEPGTHQVMAYYTHGTSSEVWSDRGFIRRVIPADMEPLVGRLQRDCQLVINPQGDIVAAVPSINPVQPESS